jgi:hypothetical protein
MWAINLAINTDPVEEKIFIPTSTRRYFWFKRKKLTILWRDHSSTSISALGMAIASNLKGEFKQHTVRQAHLSLQVWLLKDSIAEFTDAGYS